MTLLPNVFSSPYRMMQSMLAKDDAARRGAELVATDGRALPLVATRLRAEAGGGLVRFVLEQTFANVHDEALRVTYKMPLPADGAVSGYAFQIGLRTITGRVDPKETARERFEQAIAEGKTAAILEQERADVFTQEIGNIPPREAIVARITVDAPLAWLPEGAWELRFPTVIGPRYDAPPEVAIQIAGGDVGARMKLELQVNDTFAPGGAPVSPSHALRSKEGGGFELAAEEGARLDRDLVVRWPVAQREVGVSLVTARPKQGELHAHLAYGLLTVVPPAPDARAAFVPRDLIVLLDTSGSMSGPPLAQAKRVVGMLIDALGPEDRIELVEFSSEPRRWKPHAVAATAAEKREALAWLRSLEAGGATEMYSGVKEALRSIRSGAQRQVVLVTDGYIGNEAHIVELCHERLPQDCRFHVAGVGAAVNRTLAASLARAGRGAEILVGLDEDVERAAKRLLDRTAAPVLTEVTISGDAIVQLAPEHVPDVFAGAPVVAAMSLRPEGGEIVVRGNLARGTWERRVRVPATAAGEGSPAIVALYGREHVADLEMRWTIGREVEMIDRTIEKVGIAFQIATRRTSWVAIDEERRVDGRSRHEVMPQEIPYGTTLASFGIAPLAAPGGAPPMAMAARAMAPMAAPAQPSMPMSYSVSAREEGLSRGFGAPPGAGPAPLPQKRASRPRTVLFLVVLLLLLVLAALAAFFLRR